MFKLSKQQKEILMSVYADSLVFRHNPRSPGISWRTLEASRSRQSSVSRSLRRLEERGLLVRTNHWSGIPGSGRIRTRLDEPAPVRTDHVILTEEGTDVAEQLFEGHLNR